MAFSLKFSGFKWEKGHCKAIAIPGEVPGDEAFLKDSRFRNISSDPGYVDLYAVLSPKEAIDITRVTLEGLVASWMKFDPESSSEKDLEEMRAAIRISDIVIAHVYEWESGLNE